MDKLKVFFKPRLYIIVALYVILIYIVLAFGDNVASLTVREDKYFEAVGALSFFITSVVFFLALLRARKLEGDRKVFWIKQLAYLALAFLFFFGAGEEISWGQRIFDVQTPESISTVNDQNEITVHNLSFGGVNIPFETMFDMLWISLTVLLPFASVLVKPFGRFADRFVPIVHWGIGLLFVANYLWAKVAKLLFVAVYTYDRVPFRQAVQEIKESNYAVLFILVALFALLDVNRIRDATDNQ